MKSFKLTLEGWLILGLIIIAAIIVIFAWNTSNKFNERKAKENQAKLTELAVIRDDIQNIYSQMIVLYQEIGDHEVRIFKLEPESPTLQTYLKNVKILTETIKMHRRELKKCQETKPKE